MATFTSTSGSYTTTLTVNQTSQSTADNTSVLTYSLTLTKNAGSGLWNNNSCPWSITINGTRITGTFTYDFRSYSSLTLKGDTTITVAHNSDGTKTVSCSASVDMDNTPYVYAMSPSGDLALTTIPRASDVSVSNYSITNTTGSLSATITSKANFYHKWRWKMNSGSWSSWTNKGLIATTSSTVTVANTTLLAQLPTATSGSFTIEVATYSDSGYATLVGTKSASATVSVNTSYIKPSVSLGAIGFNSTPIANHAVAGYSKVQSAWTTTNSSGASSVTTYFTVSHGSLQTTSSTSTSGTVVSNVLPASASNYSYTIYAYAKDSRGAVSTTVNTSAFGVWGYSPPTASLTAYRTTSSTSTNEDGAGAYVYVTFGGAVGSSVDNQNSIQSTSCTYSGSISGTATNGGHYALADTQSVTFKLTVTDKVTSSTASVSIAQASYPLDLYDNGSGTVGIGLGTNAVAGYVVTPLRFQVNNESSSGAVEIREDGEGGTIDIYSKSGKVFEIDAYNDNVLRVWARDDSNNYKEAVFDRTNGMLSATGGFNGKATSAGTADSATAAINSNRLAVSRTAASANTDFIQNDMVVKEYEASASNIPTAHYYHTLNIMGPDTNYASQLALGMTASALYYRRYAGSWVAWSKVEMMRTIWTGTLLGGNSITLSGAKGYQRLRVYAKMITTLFMVWEVDTQQITTVTKNFNHGELAYISNPGDHYITMAEVQMTQSGQNIVVNFVNAKNVRVGTSGSNTLNNNSNYAIYRIDGIM